VLIEIVMFLNFVMYRCLVRTKHFKLIIPIYQCRQLTFGAFSSSLQVRQKESKFQYITEVSSNTISYGEVGHQSVEDDTSAVINARQNGIKYVRADANRGWTESDALAILQTYFPCTNAKRNSTFILLLQQPKYPPP